MLRVQYLLRNHQRVVQSVEAESGVASGSILNPDRLLARRGLLGGESFGAASRPRLYSIVGIFLKAGIRPQPKFQSNQAAGISWRSRLPLRILSGIKVCLLSVKMLKRLA